MLRRNSNNHQETFSGGRQAIIRKEFMDYEVVSGIPRGILVCRIKVMKFSYYDMRNASYQQLRVSGVTNITVEKGDFFYSYSYAIKIAIIGSNKTK